MGAILLSAHQSWCIPRLAAGIQWTSSGQKPIITSFTPLSAPLADFSVGGQYSAFADRLFSDYLILPDRKSCL
jgi:hypothetical protein